MESRLAPLAAIFKFWGTLNNTQRFIVTAFLSLSVVLLVIVSLIATRPHLGVLYSGLEGEDSGAVIAKLQEKAIPYEVQGTTIKVPDKYVAQTRMELANMGLPKSSSIGFEIFDKTNLGMTEFTQNVDYQRALAGELTRSIDQIDGVVESRVHLAIPKPSVFTEKEKDTTASVILKLRPGSNLNEGQVGGIVHLVSSAVEGLKPNQVTVVDTNGNLLSEGSGDASAFDTRLSASQLKLKREYEQQMEKDVQTMLERVIGPGKAVVRVSATINMDRRESSTETYQPLKTITNENAGVIVSDETTKEVYSPKSPVKAGGVTGLRSAPGAAAATNDGGYDRTQTSKKYEVNKVTQHVIEAPGKVEQVSVAVLLDSKVDAGKIPAIRNTVATAAGVDMSNLKNKITVESITFDDSVAKQEEKDLQAIATKNSYMGVGKTVGAILLLVGFLAFLKILLSRVNIAIPEPVMIQEVPVGSFNTDGMHSSSTVAEAYRQASESNGIGPEGVTVGAQANPLTQISPEEVAEVLKKWMTEN